MFNLQNIYQMGVTAILLLALLGFFMLLYVVAPYGRHWRPKFGPSLNPRIGFLLMELPSVILFAWIYLRGTNVTQPVTLVLFGLWELHYIQRTFIYPLRMRPGVNSWSVIILVSGGIFNVANSSLNAIALTHLSTSYPNSWITDPRFLFGVTVFLIGFIINVYSDHLLRNLRKSGETGYKIPHGGLFHWVTSPNYFGEILEWCGWAIANTSIASIAFAIFTFANLAPRARAHHRWYLDNFPEYPENRKFVIPFIF